MSDDNLMTTFPFPPPAFWVYSGTGKLLGYGAREVENVFEVYLPGGDDEGFLGTIFKGTVEYSSGVVAGRVVENQLLYETDVVAGEIRDDVLIDRQNSVIGRTVGDAPLEARAGAILLLILCRWNNPDGTPNLSVR